MAAEFWATMVTAMGADAVELRFDRRPRCPVCGDVIGVYERLVQVVGDRVRLTSRAADPGSCRNGETCFHLSCYPQPVDLPLD